MGKVAQDFNPDNTHILDKHAMSYELAPIGALYCLKAIYML